MAFILPFGPLTKRLLSRWLLLRYIFLALPFITAVSGPAYAQLKAGQIAPPFSASGALAGQPYPFELSKARDLGPVVVYFFPKAFTSGCTLEAQIFAEHAAQFKSMNTTVVGVSGDDLETLQRFSEGPCGGKFAVLSDPDRSIMKAYDASRRIQTGMADRISYVIAPDASIIAVFDGMSPIAHVSSSLDAVTHWHENHVKNPANQQR